MPAARTNVRRLVGMDPGGSGVFLIFLDHLSFHGSSRQASADLYRRWIKLLIRFGTHKLA